VGADAPGRAAPAGASSSATIEIIQFPYETPRGGTFGFSESVLIPAPKTYPKMVLPIKG
jgi:hypothetical protein